MNHIWLDVSHSGCPRPDVLLRELAHLPGVYLSDLEPDSAAWRVLIEYDKARYDSNRLRYVIDTIKRDINCPGWQCLSQ